MIRVIRGGGAGGVGDCTDQNCEELVEGTCRPRYGGCGADCQASTVGHMCCEPGNQYWDDQDACGACSVGKFKALTAWNPCDACPAGQYQDSAGQSSCHLCPAGKYLDETGATSENWCSECEAGQYASSEGQSSCDLCPAGKYLGQTGATSEDLCLQCEAGQYASSEGQSSCDLCPAGQYQDSAAQSSCHLCPAGKYRDSEGADSEDLCLQCEAGQYASSDGQSSCDLCPAGQYQDSAAQSSCHLCPAGKYRDSEGADSEYSCSQCQAGKYASSHGQSSCDLCPAGEYQDSEGQSSCDPCPAGKYKDSEGQEGCLECPENTFSESERATMCANCPAEKYSAPGADRCDCNTGNACMLDGDNGDCIPDCFDQCQNNDECTHEEKCDMCNCGVGKTWDGIFGHCVPCAAGTFKDWEGPQECEPCEWGMYQPEWGASTCFNCPADTYSNDMGAAHCAPCDHGMTSNPGSSECNCPNNMELMKGCVCIRGHYGQACTPCPQGTFKPEPGFAHACETCAPGQTSVGWEDPGKQEHRVFGTFGSSECSPCPEGTFLRGSDCLRCDDFGLDSFCANCDSTGWWSPEGSTKPWHCRPPAFISHLKYDGDVMRFGIKGKGTPVCVDGSFRGEWSGGVCTPCYDEEGSPIPEMCEHRPHFCQLEDFCGTARTEEFMDRARTEHGQNSTGVVADAASLRSTNHLPRAPQAMLWPGTDEKKRQRRSGGEGARGLEGKGTRLVKAPGRWEMRNEDGSKGGWRWEVRPRRVGAGRGAALLHVSRDRETERAGTGVGKLEG